jgi:curli biogenesis system outer membrane secretion channel CsgG
MLKVHRIVVSILLFVVLTQGRLCAQRADDTINSALKRLSQALIESFNQLERREFRNRLAVLEFENGSELARQQNLGSAFSEILTNYLSDNTNVFDVYERRQLGNILREQELALSDLADQNEVIEIGKLTGAHLLVLGSVLQVGNNVQVIARLVETETGQILVSHTELIPKSVFVGITEYLVERAWRYCSV